MFVCVWRIPIANYSWLLSESITPNKLSRNTQRTRSWSLPYSRSVESFRTVISCCQQLSQVVPFHLVVGLTTVFSFSILCFSISSAVTTDMSSNITLPTISVQITSQNIPLLASQRHESIFSTAVSAIVELIHPVSAYLFQKTTKF